MFDDTVTTIYLIAYNGYNIGEKLKVLQDALAELEKEHGKYVPLKCNNKVKQ